MSRTLIQFKILWNKEKEYYRKTEVGTGVQSFVKQLLESELFNLKEGKLSTKLVDRKNEFIHEKRAKESRKADFYIYINQEIAIPVEVECYGNIEVGEKQLLNYQKDFEKHYGILTDGYIWRFYNNNVFKSFTLEDLINNTQLFLTFWKEYIKPEFYYLSFFEKTGQLALVEETKLHVEDSRQLFFEDITKLIQSFKNKLQIEGYLEESDKKDREKRSIELTYAYVIQFILYKTLVDNDFDDFAKEFEFIVKKIHEYLISNRFKDILGVIEGISAKISQNIYRPFTQEQKFIKDKIQELYHSVENKLSDVSPWLDIFVFIKKYNFANVKNEIFGYIYENYLKALYQDQESKKGQYFTDPAIVNFMLDQIGYTPDRVDKRFSFDKNSISIIDPSCGSGTFLYSATDSIVKAFQDGNSEDASIKIEEAITNSVFGLDIEEFPLYLAEMNILMRMLPLIINEKYNNPIDKKIKVFKTRDSISEFMDTAIRNTFSDQTIEFQKKAVPPGQIHLFTEKLNLGYSSYVRDESDLEEMKKSLENQLQCPRRRFDFVIGNPPYISYNECSKQGVLIVKLIQNKKCSMNDIYGVNLNTVVGHSKPYAPKPNLYSFFIALGLSLLKDNGTLCYIIPQTVLVNTDLDVIRYHLAKFTTINKIITFRGKMFVGRGLLQKQPIITSSLIFVVDKTSPADLHEVEIVNYMKENSSVEDCLKDVLIKKNISTKKVLQKELLHRLTNWNFIKLSKTGTELLKSYLLNTESIDVYRNYDISLDRFKDIFIIDGSINIQKKDIQSDVKIDFNKYYKIYGYDKKYTLKLFGYYPKSKKIKIAKGSQGLKIISPRYKVYWKYINHDHFYYISGEDVLPIYQQYCIASNNKLEIMYLLSLLNSPSTSFILNVNLKVVNEEKLGLLLGVRVLKEFFRVPKISEFNQFIKVKIIKLTQDLLEIETVKLSDFVDFSKILKQKFDKVGIQGNKFILEKDEEKMELPIKRDISLVSKVVEINFGQDSFGSKDRVITLSELISLPVIDYDKQKEMKDLIDDLIFCLYFNINIPKDKLSNAKFVRSLCLKNKFYKQISIN